MTRMTLKKLETELPGFLRIHRSYIINPRHCQAFDRETITVDGEQLPVGRTYRDKVLARLES